MNIPRKIKIGTVWYHVVLDASCLRAGHMGYIDYDKKSIQIAECSTKTGRAFKDKDIEDTFWHEVIHAILHDMGSTLRNNEKFVTAFSSRLTKAINSARF
jgi:hypothetical protein